MVHHEAGVFNIYVFVFLPGIAMVQTFKSITPSLNSDDVSNPSNITINFSMDSSKYLAVTNDLDITKLATGQSLLAYLFEENNLGDGESDVDGGWPKTLTNYGSPFGTDVSITAKNVNHDGVEGTSGSESFVLLGNPFGWSLSTDLSFDYDNVVRVLAKSQAPKMFELNLVHSESERSSTFNLRSAQTTKEGIDSYDGCYLGSYANSSSNLLIR